MSELTNPHDRFFKEALAHSESTRDFLKYYLPPVVAELLDVSSAELVKDSFVDEELHEHFSDLLCQVDLKAGGEAYVYVLFEHKSSPDSFIAFQMLRYIVRVWDYALERRARLVPIVPLVVYHGLAAWRIPLNLHALLDIPEQLRPLVPEYSYCLCDLSRYTDAELKGAVMLRSTLLALKHIYSDDLREWLPEMESLWRELAEQKTGLEYLRTLWRYLAMATDRLTETDLQQVIEAAFPQTGGGIMTTIAEKWVEQGVQQGVQQGMQQGMQQGLRQGLLSGIKVGLKLKFGSESLRLLPEICKIDDVGVLEAIQEGIAVVTTPDDLRRIYQ
jgi:predicted transposase/invertase (TIGR01784 family)